MAWGEITRPSPAARNLQRVASLRAAAITIESVQIEENIQHTLLVVVANSLKNMANEMELEG